MIVLMTSWAPTVAFRIPAMPAHSAPASVASTMVRTMWAGPAMPAHEEPTQADTVAPTTHCPVPPMLNSPQRNAKATARPVRMSVVVTSSVCCRLNAASTRSSPPTHGKNQSRPVP